MKLKGRQGGFWKGVGRHAKKWASSVGRGVKKHVGTSSGQGLIDLAGKAADILGGTVGESAKAALSTASAANEKAGQLRELASGTSTTARSSGGGTNAMSKRRGTINPSATSMMAGNRADLRAPPRDGMMAPKPLGLARKRMGMSMDGPPAKRRR